MLKDILFSSFIKKIKANYWKLWMQSQISLTVTSHCHLLCNSTKVTMFLSQVLLVKILTELQEASTISDAPPSNWVPERRHYGTGFGAQTDNLGSSPLNTFSTPKQWVSSVLHIRLPHKCSLKQRLQNQQWLKKHLWNVLEHVPNTLSERTWVTKTAF